MWGGSGHLHTFSTGNSSLSSFSFFRPGLIYNEPHRDTTVHLWQSQRAHSETEDRPAEPKLPQRDPRNGFLPLQPRALPPRLQPLRPNKGRCPRSVPSPRPRACINVRPSESSLTPRAKPGSVTSGGEGSEETVTKAPTGFSQNRTKPHKD